MTERLVGVALGDEDLVYASAGSERLDHGVAPFDYLVFNVIIVVHGYSSYAYT